MEYGRPLTSSPVLFGRDDLLALGARRLQHARDGQGQLLFLAGEAGIGKTRLLEALARLAEREGAHVVTAAVFPGDLELSGGLLIDLGHQLARAEVPGRAEIGTAITAVLASDGSVSGDAHRRRRLMVLDLVDCMSELSAAGPLMLALEDLHWSDDLTLEVLAQFARRLQELPVLVIGTYRNDELYPRVPMRQWRTRLLSQRLAEEARLRRLSFSEVHSMASL
ncbi:MAG: ATP-binding protein, partial [Geodermatophilaceae bacterium]|nr:ATP-binding protein [Geodermatophilaceae bacterium]